ncbi:MAG: four helix bundle protein [Bacteroidetes bacterium]|nr:four helix bundle protein [Bacteroidota bacterium]
MFDFQNLEVYKKAKSFHKSVRALLKAMKLENYINDQLGRASFSIALNIAEGSAKFSKPDRRNYFTTARGSVFECVAILDMLHDDSRINKEAFEQLLLNADELSRILYAMIKNLEK